MTPKGWRCEPLTSLGTLIKARGGTKKDQTPTGVPVVRYGELYTRHGALIRRFYSFVPEDKASAYTQLRAGDILFAGSGETLDDIGRAAAFLGPEPAHASGDLILLRPSGDLDPAFLGYATNGQRAQAQKRRLGQGSSVFHIHAEKLAQLTLLLPPLGEQRKIAAILSSVDDAIEATQAVIDQLQVVKKAMMAELLTRGLPGRHTRFKMTEIGEVPEEWEVVPLANVASVGNGSTPSKQRSDYWDGGTVPWLPTGKVNDRIISNADAFVTEKALAECSIRLLPVGTLLIAMIGQGKTRGKVAYLAIEATINQNFAYVRAGAALSPWFLFAFLDHHYERLRSDGRGSNQDALNCGLIKRWLVPLPPLEEQDQIADVLRALEAREVEEIAAREGLGSLKASLMSALLTGEVRVKPDEEAA